MARLVDRSEFCEFRGMYCRALLCGWARIAGALLLLFIYACLYSFIDTVVGCIFASGAPIDRASAESACQFVQSCNDAKLPLIITQNTIHDGWSKYKYGEFLIFTVVSNNLSFTDDIKAHGQLLSALACTDSHKIVVNVGDAFGADHWLTVCDSFCWQ
jgi:hypothetical protein